MLSVDRNMEDEEAYNLYKQIANNQNVKRYSITKFSSITMDKSELELTDEGKRYLEGFSSDEEENNTYYVTMVALGNEEYNRYLKDLGLNYEDAKDKIIWIDDFERYVYNEDGSYKKIIGELYEYNKNDEIKFNTLKDGTYTEEHSAKIIAQTSKKPMGLEGSSYNQGVMVVSDELMDKMDWRFGSLYVDVDNPDKFEQEIKKEYKNVTTYNIEAEANRETSLIIIIAIFLYGFIIVISLIGVTNIFNTITSNMNLRSKEFANLKSIGMTKKEFNRMIRLESIFYGLKSIIIGVPLGVVGSYLLYLAFNEGIMMPYTFPLIPTIIAVIIVFLLIGGIMKYSLNKINKQNIIETIRKDNI